MRSYRAGSSVSNCQSRDRPRWTLPRRDVCGWAVGRGWFAYPEIVAVGVDALEVDGTAGTGGYEGEGGASRLTDVDVGGCWEGDGGGR